MSFEDLKISVVTPVFNGAAMIKYCMGSVDAQSYQNKEHVIVDGLSSDNTVALINNNKAAHVKLLSEQDRGLYDGFNKGIRLAAGDIICFLCADDMYAHENVLESVANTFRMNRDADMVYGDIVYVDRDDLCSVVRYWKSSAFKPGLFRKGWMAPNTALFIRKELFGKYGFFDFKYKMAADYELQFRLFEKYLLKSVYIPGVMVRMRSGGVSNSSLGNMYKSLGECNAALLQHHVPHRLLYIINTILYRIRQKSIPAEIKRLNERQALHMAKRINLSLTA
jgi:glycosyltransferase involved in cell wall biosynthesis